jgi:hypothetical protein
LGLIEVDRQKGTRILKRLKKELSALDDEPKKTKLQKRIHNAEVDVNYAIYYPLMKPYSSLYPKSKNQKTDDSEDAEEEGEATKNNSSEIDGPKGDVDMWRAVEQAMEEGTLEKLRYSKNAVPAEPPKKNKKKPMAKENKNETSDGKTKSTQQKAAGSRSYPVQDEGEESDGGFFE